MWAPTEQTAAQGPPSADVEMKDDKIELMQKVKHQIDFYFSETNLLKDKYLQNLLKSSTHECQFNCVPLAQIL